jgi:Phage protein (N4 Gp49/phage Sf6 gene 66) family
VDDKAIEQEIVAKGKTAPRISLADIEAVIAFEWYVFGKDIPRITTPVMGPAYLVPLGGEALGCLTLCVLVLKNGFTVTGESACASPENFDAELGRKIARQKAVDKVWMLEGYLLKDKLHATRT